jgi:6-phosphogluconolactonase/glucosamine-6-phosphate isomerase/deaminase
VFIDASWAKCGGLHRQQCDRGRLTGAAHAGGSLLKSLGSLVGAKGVEWAKWHIFFGDERNVPHSSGDSTIKGAREAFLGRVPIPAAQVHAIAEGLSVEVRFCKVSCGPCAFCQAVEQTQQQAEAWACAPCLRPMRLQVTA